MYLKSRHVQPEVELIFFRTSNRNFQGSLVSRPLGTTVPKFVAIKGKGLGSHTSKASGLRMDVRTDGQSRDEPFFFLIRWFLVAMVWLLCAHVPTQPPLGHQGRHRVERKLGRDGRGGWASPFTKGENTEIVEVYAKCSRAIHGITKLCM